MLNPLFQPRAAALPQGGAHFLIREHAIPFGSQPHCQRDESIQVGSLLKLFAEAAVCQDELTEAFQILRFDSQSTKSRTQGTAAAR